MNIKEELTSLQLPKNSFMVVGSSILGTLGLKKSDDIDLIVSPEAFKQLVDLGWDQVTEIGGLILKHYPFDVGLYWEEEGLEHWLPKAVIIDDIPYLSLVDLRRWKTERNRPKDPADVALIDDYLEKHPEAR